MRSGAKAKLGIGAFADPDLLGLLEYRSCGPAADAIIVPEAEPGAVSEGFVVPSVRSGDIAGAERADIRSLEHLLELLDVVDNAFNIHR